MKKLGTLSWLERTGGTLAWHDRLTLIAQGIRAKAAAKMQQGIKLRLREVADIQPPDSAITREAIALCQDASEPYLFNHCLRAYYWARLLDNDDRNYDQEAMFTAMMLHDIGLTERYRIPADQQQCFTLAGARLVQDLAHKHAWSDKRANIAANAIALHLNIIVGAEHGKEAQLVRIGSGADVAGLRLTQLHGDQIDEVVNRHPRLNMRRNIVQALNTEATTCPCCRIAFLRDRLGFHGLIHGTRVFNE
jgi:hypothetical protein